MILRWNSLLNYQIKFKIKYQGYGCPYESSTAAAIWRCKDLNIKSKPSKVLQCGGARNELHAPDGDTGMVSKQGADNGEIEGEQK